VIALAATSAFTAARAGCHRVGRAGTGTHNIDPPGVPCTSTDGCDPDGVDYPASFFPLGIIPGPCPGLSCDTWNKSVGTGVTNLDDELHNQLDHPTADNEKIIIFGYSQGGAVVSQEMYNIPDDVKDRAGL
jgi:hypothetical protein